MKTKTIVMSAALCAGTLELTACGGGSATSSAPPVTAAPQTEMLDTEQVLALAEAPSETNDPKPVGTGAWMVADAEDATSDPMPVG
jgi:hypothetical protein